MIRFHRCLFAAAVAVLAAASPVGAGFTMSASSGGMSSLSLSPGSAFSIDIVLSSDAADVINSAIFRVEFSKAGLGYSAYSWSNPFVAGSMFDQSVPGLGNLPTFLDQDTLSGGSYPSQVVDIELANAAPGMFAGGVLVTLDLFVPVNFPRGDVILSLVPDTFAHGFQIIPTVAGDSFTVTVIPSCPTVYAIFGILFCRERRRIRRQVERRTNRGRIGGPA